MRNLLLVLMLSPLLALSQNDKSSGKPASKSAKSSKSKAGIGVIAGLNFANVTKVSSFSSSNETGFMVGGFYSPPTGGIMGFRMELVYSKQGYDYKTNTNTGTVDKQYLIIPAWTVINIGKFSQLLFGMQTSYLLNATADSSSNQSSTDPSSNQYSGGMTDLFKRANFGLAGGLEIYPYKGIIIGGRYNVSLGDMYKTPSSNSPASPTPSFLPPVDAKNNVVQLYLGYRF